MATEQVENDRSFAMDGWENCGPSSYSADGWDNGGPSSYPTCSWRSYGPTNGSGDSSAHRSTGEYLQSAESAGDGWGPSNGSDDPSAFLSTGDFLQSAESVGDGWRDEYAESEKPSWELEKECKCAGLRNLGNTCFMNSVLQCLTYTVPLANKIVTGHHKASCQIKGFCAMCAVEDHIKVVLSACGGTVSPSYLANSLDQISRNFIPGQQQDAHEFFFCFIEGLQKCCKSDGLSNTTQVHNDTFISDILMGEMKSQVRCNSCSKSSDSVEAFLGLSLEIENRDSIDEALSSFMAVEELQEEVKATCPYCKEVSSRSKQLRFSKSPQVLPIHLKRYKASEDFPTKIEREIKYGLSLDLTPFVCKGGATEKFELCDWKYRLYAVLVHSGWSTTSGHYYCYVQTSPGIWHCMNDSLVYTVSEKAVLNEEAYILFYIREIVKEELLSGTPPRESLVSARSLTSEAATNVVSSTVKEACSSASPLDNNVDGDAIQCQLPQSTPSGLLQDELKEIDIEDSFTCSEAKLLDGIPSRLCFDGENNSALQSPQAPKSPVLPSNGGSPKECVKPKHVQVEKGKGINSSLTQGRTASHPYLAGSTVVAVSPFENGSQHSFMRLVNKMPSGRRQALMASVFPSQEGKMQSIPIRNMKDTSVNTRAVKGLKQTEQNGRPISRGKSWSDNHGRCKMQRVGGKRVLASYKDSGVHHEIHGLAKANT